MLQATSSYKKLALLITDGRSNVGGSPAAIAKSMRSQLMLVLFLNISLKFGLGFVRKD